jgi:hypothetical protein
MCHGPRAGIGWAGPKTPAINWAKSMQPGEHREAHWTTCKIARAHEGEGQKDHRMGAAVLSLRKGLLRPQLGSAHPLFFITRGGNPTRADAFEYCSWSAVPSGLISP